MALSTDTQADQFSFIKWLQAAEAEADQRPPRGAQRTFKFRFALATTELQADDRKRLLWFPAGIFLLDAVVFVEDELDSNGAPALVWDLITETAAGSADSRKVIAGSTAGQSAGEADRIDDAAVGAYVGERYLVFDPTTASATAAAGEFTLLLTVARGIAVAALPAISMDDV